MEMILWLQGNHVLKVSGKSPGGNSIRSIEYVICANWQYRLEIDWRD